MAESNVRKLLERNQLDTGVERSGIMPSRVESVGLVGAGLMGTSIAAANLLSDVPVAITDAAPELVCRGVEQVFERISHYDDRASRPEGDLGLAARLTPVTSLEELSGCDLIIESVVENADVKRRIYSRLEPHLQPDAILASNTSTIPISGLARGLEHPERLCGIHFFVPVRNRPLIEIVRGNQTADKTIVTAVAYAKRLDRVPIVVNDGPGFLVNRLLLPYMSAALHLISDGAQIEAIERAARDFGMPVGPIELFDIIGIDTAVMGGRVLWEAFPDRIVALPIATRLVKLGRLGQKSGEGFYSYRNPDKRPEPDPGLAEILKPYIRKRDTFTFDEITARLFLPMLVEATRVLQEGIVRDVRDIDLGVIFGLGFPQSKGGLLFWADTLGAERVLDMLKPFARLSEPIRPTPLLEEIAAKGWKFYAE